MQRREWCDVCRQIELKARLIDICTFMKYTLDRSAHIWLQYRFLDISASSSYMIDLVQGQVCFDIWISISYRLPLHGNSQDLVLAGISFRVQPIYKTDTNWYNSFNLSGSKGSNFKSLAPEKRKLHYQNNFHFPQPNESVLDWFSSLSS